MSIFTCRQTREHCKIRTSAACNVLSGAVNVGWSRSISAMLGLAVEHALTSAWSSEVETDIQADAPPDTMEKCRLQRRLIASFPSMLVELRVGGTGLSRCGMLRSRNRGLERRWFWTVRPTL
jgi:hypothetical protein